MTSKDVSSNDIHVWLDDAAARQLRALAKRQDRSLAYTARMILRLGLRAWKNGEREKDERDAS